MKLILPVVLLISVYSASAFFPVPIPVPVPVPVLGGGLGLGLGGGLGLGLGGGFLRRRIAFGGLGFRRRLGLGFPFPIRPIIPVLPLGPVPVPVLGKRSIEDMTVSNSTEVTCEITSFESVSSKMFCEGKTHNFECDLERHFSIEHMEHQLEELRILPKEEPKEKLSKSVILSVRPEESMFNNFTMEHKNETMLFTLFHDKDFTDEGFRVKNLTCWEKFEEMMDQNEQVKLSMKLSF